MITFRQFLLESARLNIEYEGDWSKRVFATAKLKDEHKNFLQSGEVLRGEATIDIDGETAKLNQINAYPVGEKFGPELLEDILKELKQRGIKTVRAYIESGNSSSRSMVRKLGFEKAESTAHGDYWELK